MQTTNGAFRDKFSRRYVYVNPDIYQGPWTWRLSNLVPSADPGDDLLSIFTVLPIDDEQTAPGVYRLFFNIEDLPDIRTTSTQTVARGRTATSFLASKTVKGLKQIEGIAPVATSEIGDDVAIYFSIASLEPLVTRKRKFNVKGFNYNSKSIDNLSADKPLYVSSAGATTAIVSFDIRQLDHA